MKLIKCPENPIISPNPDNPWEELITCNPGVIYADGTFYMLYRAAGNDEQHVIRFGLATSTDGVHFRRESSEPIFSPSADGPDSGCVEDPRIVKLGQEFYVTYAYRPVAPGRYWEFAHDVVLVPECGPDAPTAYRKSMGNTGLAMTTDFHTFRRLGRLTESRLDDRDVMFFPEKIGGQYVMMHRPKQYVGPDYGVDEPSIWLKFSDDLLTWETRPSHLLITGRRHSWEDKIGGSAPPLRTPQGWLMLYHGVEDGGLGYYRVGALLLDLNDPLKVIGRTPEPILEPEYPYETEGMYCGCVFPTGNVIVDGTLYVYYGAADKYVGLATCPVADLVEYLLSEECRVK